MSITLTAQDKSTLRTAAYGAVSLLAAAGAANSSHKIATHGSIALASSTGAIGHVLAAKTKDIKLEGKSVAALADNVLPALTATVNLLKGQDPAEAGNFRDIVMIAVDTATGAAKGGPNPVLTDMTRKITEALDAA